MSIESNTSDYIGRDAKLGVYFADAEAKGIPHSQMYDMVDHSASGEQKRAAQPRADRRVELAQELIVRIDEIRATRAAAAEGDIA